MIGNNRIAHTAVTALVVLLVCGQTSASADCKRISVASYGGGAYQQSHIDAFEQPFTNSRHILARSVVWDANYGALKSMVSSGQVEWDVVDIPAAEYQRAHSEGLLQNISPTISADGFRPGTVHPDGVGNVYWATVLAYNKSAYPTQRPASWKDFFDLKRFPGPRALYDDPRANLEFALLADGVPLRDIYPLTPDKIDRAFKKLDTIKSAVMVWWNDGSRPVQLLLNNLVVMSPVWSGRVFASQTARSNIGYTWNGAALELDYWVIPKGSRCQREASAFIAFSSTPAVLATQARQIGYGPANSQALHLVGGDIVSQLPTDSKNFSVSFVVDATNWWAIEDGVRARWTKWRNVR